MLLSILLIIAGIAALYFGAEWLVKGAVSLAVGLGMTPLIAGLTVVAFGTSSPELVVSLTAAWNGQGDLALGNVVGSNIFNIAVILALTAAIVPMKVQLQLFKFDTPVLAGTALLFAFFFRDRTIDRWEGAVLFAGLIAYVAANVGMARRQRLPDAVADEFASEITEIAPQTGGSTGWKDGVLIVLGLAFLVAGSRAFVTGAVDIARAYGLSEAVIGLTIVAAGTSLPELASSLVAAFRGQADVAVGNVIGSNVFNTLGILGISSLAAGPLPGAGISTLDLWAMLIATLLLIPIIWTGMRIQRWEGVGLLAGYAVYLFFLWPA